MLFYFTGFCAAPLWTAQSSYISTTAIKYAMTAGLCKDATITKFLSIFYVLFQTSQVVGNVISSLVLKPTTVGMI